MQIYKTTNLLNNKFYIGQDSKDNPNYLGSGKLIEKAILKYGKHNFKKEILEKCNSLEELDKCEIKWITQLNATNRKIAYNICEGGRVNRTMRGENHPFYGKKHTEETRKKISENTKKVMTPEIKQIIKDKRKLQVFSKETRELWSKQRKGNPKYGRKGILNINYGKHLSEETKRKIGDANRGENNGMYKCGDKNPMYGKSVYSVWVKKYGIKEADKKMKELGDKISKSNKGKHSIKHKPHI